MQRRAIWLVLTFVAGVVLGLGSFSWAKGQAFSHPGAGQTFTITTDTAGHVIQSTEPKPLVLESESLGLRVVGRRHGRVIGTLVAKVDGEWVEVQFAPQNVLAAE